MRLTWALLVAAAVSLPGAGKATTITYTTTDLPDVVQGEDLWQYSYGVSGVTFNAGFGFSIFFDYTMYGALESPPPAVSPDWDIISLQPDVNLPDDGLYDALALVNGASLAQPFTVTFVWLGQGSPGSQSFEVYDPSSQAIEAGTTVPEPSVLILAVACAAVGSAMLWITSVGKHRAS